jgi:hypothetical protein
MATNLPKPPKLLRVQDARDIAELKRRTDEWARGVGLSLEAYRAELERLRSEIAVLESSAASSDGGGGVTDHGALTGLADDDHTQYLRTDGTRALTGNQSAGGNLITNLGAPTASGHALRWDDVRSELWDPNAPATSPHSCDDEFSGGSLDGKWTVWDPGSYLTQSMDTTKQAIVLSGVGNNTVRWSGVYQAVPVGLGGEFCFTTRVAMNAHLPGTNGGVGGLFLADDIASNPTTADLVVLYTILTDNNANKGTAVLARYPSYNGGESTDGTSPAGVPMTWLRMRVSIPGGGGGEFTGEVSHDGMTWYRVGGNSIGYTPSYFGLVFTPVMNGITFYMHAPFFRCVSGAGKSATANLFDFPGRLVRRSTLA